MNDPHGDRLAWLAEGNARQARKRVAAKVLIRNQDGNILLVNPNYKDYWDLPGGMAEANEAPTHALRREIQEELGLSLEVGRLLVVDWVGPYGPWDDQLMFLFDGGTLPIEQEAAIRVADDEISEFGFFPAGEAMSKLRPDVAHRLANAIAAEQKDGACYVETPRPGHSE